MAPEQTGRMNRSIDSRSDLYALGVTLYEMVTGTLPFTASDPMELVHSHIARQPVPPGKRLNGIPGPVSTVVMKLLAKTAEERYQTAAGATSDLRRCLDEWETKGWIDEFPLGEHDTPDRLLIPEKLYGRASEIETLLAAFDRIVAGGRPELVLVSGYSGIGKSSVVNELHKPLVPPRGLFASGKFDQYKREIPYATLAQAFQSLIRLLLSKSEKELSRWRDALREALEPNGQLIVDLVPELKLIIGEQPPDPDAATSLRSKAYGRRYIWQQTNTQFNSRHSGVWIEKRERSKSTPGLRSRLADQVVDRSGQLGYQAFRAVVAGVNKTNSARLVEHQQGREPAVTQETIGCLSAIERHGQNVTVFPHEIGGFGRGLPTVVDVDRPNSDVRR
jgi:serine/threonine protein kinase